MDKTLQFNRVQAVQTHNCIQAMIGNPGYQLIRQNILKRIEEIWPEVMANDQPTEPDITREIVLTSKEQRVMAEGFVDLLNRKDQSGAYMINTANFAVVEASCRACKVWNWVKTQVVQDIPDFDQQLDDEPPISDDETPKNPV
jgi:hypothetical protein